MYMILGEDPRPFLFAYNYQVVLAMFGEKTIPHEVILVFLPKSIHYLYSYLWTLCSVPLISVIILCANTATVVITVILQQVWK